LTMTSLPPSQSWAAQYLLLQELAGSRLSFPSNQYTFPPPAQLQSQSQSRRPLGEREKFLLFVKVIFRYLEKTNNQRLHQQAKAIVYECTRRNRMGDSNYASLRDAVEVRLRLLLGDDAWTCICYSFQGYCQRRGLR